MDYIIDELGVFFPLIVIASLFYIASKLGSAPGLIKERQRRLEKEKYFPNPSDISVHSILDNYYIKPREDAPLPIEIRIGLGMIRLLKPWTPMVISFLTT